MSKYYKYNITKYNYNIDIIIISKYIIQISYNDQIIIFKKNKIWNNNTRFIITDNDKITVLHPIIKTDTKKCYKHMLGAFYHINPNLNDKYLLFLFISILSFKEYPILTKKFKIFWNNNYINENYKLLTYKLKYENIDIMM